MSVSQVDVEALEGSEQAQLCNQSDVPSDAGSLEHPEPANSKPLDKLLRPAAEQPLDAVLQNVQAAIAPVWPLKDYVAVNPFLGLADRSFLEARQLLRSVSDCEMLMPLEYFADQYHRGHLQPQHIEKAVAECEANNVSGGISVEEIVRQLSRQSACDKSENYERRVRTVAEIADQHGGSDWSTLIVDELGRHCAAHYDEGQAAWSSPWKHLPLFEAWRSAAQLDRRPETLGMTGFRRFVGQLPEAPETAIAEMLEQLKVPDDLREAFLLCQAHSVPGWSAWTRYQSAQKDEAGHSRGDFVSLLAIRLAYDTSIAESSNLRVDWSAMVRIRELSRRSAEAAAREQALTKSILLRASEIAYERRLLGSLSAGAAWDQSTRQANASENQEAEAAQPPLAQMVFCIDVRSERYRRCVEQVSADVHTFGFAGFFGVPMAVQSLGEAHAAPHLPALLSPAFTVSEGIRDASEQDSLLAKERRLFRRTLRKCWKQFQTSAVGCFGFVETFGLTYGWQLVSKLIHRTARSGKFDGVKASDQSRLGPDLSGLAQQGVTPDRQIELAAGILRGIGLTDDFAGLVVFCGHGSTTQNNPLQAGLDCGACCGHSGEPNARFAAMLLNQPHVRSGLAAQQIHIPADTHFLAAVHDTTRDTVRYFDTDLMPAARQADLQELMASTTAATDICLRERMPQLAAGSVQDVLQRSADWSEVRPEWGLAGNAAFIVGPRSLTQRANLDGRSFLHSYDYRRDTGFKVLEQIMTAPMVVAHWINMQYYASSVDNRHYGSGSKTIHNVVGKFGLFSGNGGDLTTGLPWQSVHNGNSLQHEPLRLLSVIAAPRHAVADIISRHEGVENLLVNDWLNLVVLDQGIWYRFTGPQSWTAISTLTESEPEPVYSVTRGELRD